MAEPEVGGTRRAQPKASAASHITTPNVWGQRSGKLLPPDTGTPAVSPQFEQPLRWQGRWYVNQAGGLYDFRNRFWSPELGAFLSPDEFGYLTRTGTLWSWPGQNPMAFRDPEGRDGGLVTIFTLFAGSAEGAGALAAGATVAAPFVAIAAGGLAGVAIIDAALESAQQGQRDTAIAVAVAGAAEANLVLAKKRDIQLVDEIARRYGLDRELRRRLHDELQRGKAGRRNIPRKEIEEIAEEIAKKAGRNHCE